MKPNLFNHTLLAVGVAAAMGISTLASAATTSGETTTEVQIKNIATANYFVAGQEQPEAKSNEVTIKISEAVSFSLTANEDDTAVGGTQDDDKNELKEVAPNGIVTFEHTLTNTGNRDDIYTVKLTDVDAKYTPTTTYKVFNDGDDSATATPVSSGSIDAAGTAISVGKDQFVQIIVSAQTAGNKGNDKPTLTLSATSSALTDNTGSATPTLTNTDSSFTKLPTFSIVKTMTNALDLNDTNDTATYQVVVKNDASLFSTKATDITIEDFLPAGLVMAEALGSANIVYSGDHKAGAIDTANNGAAGSDGFNIKGVDLDVGSYVTITFTVKKGGTGTLDPANALNHVTVTDDLDNDPDTNNTLIDSTDSTQDNVGDFSPKLENNFTDGATATEPGDDSTQPLLTIKRVLALAGPTTKQVPPTTNPDGRGEATHTATITNSGQEAEGNTAGELTFTLTDTNATTAGTVNVVPSKVKVIYENVEYLLPAVTADGDGVYTYDINDAVSTDGNSTPFPGIAPGKTADIQYNVASDNATIGTTDTESAEKIVVTLLPKGEGFPTVPEITDTTQVRGLLLFKTQSLDANCDGTSDDGNFVDTEIDAVPGQCVVYKIKAENNSDTTNGFDINSLVISDLLSNFEAQASVKEISNKSPWTTLGSSASGLTEPANVTATEVRTEIAELKPTGTATLDFTIEIKTDRLTAP